MTDPADRPDSAPETSPVPPPPPGTGATGTTLTPPIPAPLPAGFDSAANRRRQLFAIAVPVVVALLGAVFVFLLKANPSTPTGSTEAVGDRPFGDAGTLPPGVTEARWSPDGVHFAVIDNGQASLAINGSLRGVSERGGRVVDFAWMPGSNGLLIVEGPSSTGILPVLKLDGSSVGVVNLDPVVIPGPGAGAAVDPGGREAVMVGVERSALDAEQRYLAAVDLGTGATRRLTTGSDVRGPFYVGPRRVAVTVDDAANGPSVVVLDVSTGEARRVAKGEVIGAVGTRAVVVEPDGRTISSYATDGPPAPATMVRLDVGLTPVAVHPKGTAVAALERISDGKDTSVRLRSVRTKSAGPRAPSGG